MCGEKGEVDELDESSLSKAALFPLVLLASLRLKNIYLSISF